MENRGARIAYINVGVHCIQPGDAVIWRTGQHLRIEFHDIAPRIQALVVAILTIDADDCTHGVNLGPLLNGTPHFMQHFMPWSENFPVMIKEIRIDAIESKPNGGEHIRRLASYHYDVRRDDKERQASAVALAVCWKCNAQLWTTVAQLCQDCADRKTRARETASLVKAETPIMTLCHGFAKTISPAVWNKCTTCGKPIVSESPVECAVCKSIRVRREKLED